VNFRSQNSQRFQVPFGLSLLAHGTPRAVINILNKLHLSPCFDTISSTAVTLANGCITEAIGVAGGPHVLAYDNIQATTSALIEQREGAPAKVQSGTVSVIYPAFNANKGDMRLDTIHDNWCKTDGLSYAHDIRQTREQLESHFEQLVIHTIRVLRHLKGSEDIAHHQDFQHLERRKLPAGHATEQHPLRVSHIEEASVQGNIAVVNDIYISQLGMSESDFDDRAIPCINDQLTNARLRTAQLSRTSDDNAFTRLEFLQLGFGLFHAHMNLIWAVLNVHRGSFETVGSLAYFFNILDLRRLGSARPAYYPLVAAFNWILDGLLLDCWSKECGCSSLKDFKPMDHGPEHLREMAQQLLRRYLSPTLQGQHDGSIASDQIRRRTALLLRDLLYVRELGVAISDGDWGRIEDILCPLAKIFRGAGSKNYCAEILHFIHGLKKIWPHGFGYVSLGFLLTKSYITRRNVMRDNMIINMTGHAGKAEGMDENIEHLIRNDKVCATIQTT
jgi:hypothetical protein